jgi:hypothetical protein
MEGAVSIPVLVIVDPEKLLKMIVDDFLERIDRASRMVARAWHRSDSGQAESLRNNNPSRGVLNFGEGRKEAF